MAISKTGISGSVIPIAFLRIFRGVIYSAHLILRKWSWTKYSRQCTIYILSVFKKVFDHNKPDPDPGHLEAFVAMAGVFCKITRNQLAYHL